MIGHARRHERAPNGAFRGPFGDCARRVAVILAIEPEEARRCPG
jgi:hypothetical protein